MAIKNTITIEKQQQIEAIIMQLANEVISLDTSQHNHGLLGGVAGHLLFLFQAHRANSQWVDEAVFAHKLDQLQEGLTEQSFELSNGLAGQAWLLEYLNQADQQQYDAQLLEDVDQLFIQVLSQRPWHGEIESVLGIAGYAPYTARRARYSEQNTLWQAIVSGLESTATHFEDGQISWSQPKESVYRFNQDTPDTPEYNLGLAHGVPGILAALIPALQDDTVSERVKVLLEGGCDWLLAQQQRDNEHDSCFGSCLHTNAHSSRLGWCYGDLTIALTLARVGLAIDRPSYVERALEIALHSTHRDAQSAQINDAGLCHGSAGLITIYQLLDKLMPHPQLAQAAQTWLDYTLAQYEQRGLAALASFNGLTKEYEQDFGFLMGYSGIGLALLGMLSSDPDWTDCLLMA